MLSLSRVATAAAYCDDVFLVSCNRWTRYFSSNCFRAAIIDYKLPLAHYAITASSETLHTLRPAWPSLKTFARRGSSNLAPMLTFKHLYVHAKFMAWEYHQFIKVFKVDRVSYISIVMTKFSLSLYCIALYNKLISSTIKTWAAI